MHPFTKNDIAAEIRRGAKDEEEAKLWAVQVFLRYEMNIKKAVLSTLSIEKIFPQSIDDWDTIFVNFSTITMANTVTSYVRNMRSEVQVDIYVQRSGVLGIRP